MMGVRTFINCPDCGTQLVIPKDCQNAEIISCPSCGLEFEVTIKVIDGKRFMTDIKPLELTEKDEWGE